MASGGSACGTCKTQINKYVSRLVQISPAVTRILRYIMPKGFEPISTALSFKHHRIIWTILHLAILLNCKGWSTNSRV